MLQCFVPHQNYHYQLNLISGSRSPPNLGLSLQCLQTPQSSLVQAAHSPHLLILFLTFLLPLPTLLPVAPVGAESAAEVKVDEELFAEGESETKGNSHISG
jgi:hypothetical protein